MISQTNKGLDPALVDVFCVTLKENPMFAKLFFELCICFAQCYVL